MGASACCQKADADSGVVDNAAVVMLTQPAFEKETSSPIAAVVMSTEPAIAKQSPSPEPEAAILVASPVDSNMAVEDPNVDYKGAWIKGASSIVIIKTDEKIIQWSSKTEHKSDIKFEAGRLEVVGPTTPKDGASGSVDSASLDETKMYLKWADGDVWTRADITGKWVDPEKMGGLGWQMRIVNVDNRLDLIREDGKEWRDALKPGDGDNAVIRRCDDEEPVQGTIDKDCMTLTWSKGGKWNRVQED